MNAMQMTLFSVPEPEPKPEPPQPVGWGETVVVDPGPICCGRSRCREHGAYLVGSRVLCEKHAVQAVWDEIGGKKNAGNPNPYTAHCPDGFRAVRHRGREDHRSLGKHQRVQVCRSRKCKAVFAVHWLWTGEPTLCPSCRNTALREVLGQTQAIP